MIVYGDHAVEIALADVVASLISRVEGRPLTLDESRVQLVLAGQLQQAVEDAGLDCTAQCQALTATAAESFVDLSCCPAGSALPARLLQGRLADIERCISSDRLLRVRTPEGFASYALYPDAYMQAANEWASRVAPSARVLVVGIRSIGTTLAATVAAALQFRGLWVHTLTVRPEGHPFRRTATLPGALPETDHVIVVDEGPGLSGSSMVSVADALVERGFARDTLTFFCGHDHEPGIWASAAVRRWWAEVPRRSVPWKDLRFAGASASGTLEHLAQSLLREPLRGPLQDVGAGRWRELVGEPVASRYSVVPFLEQPKLLARGRSGRGILFKFAGWAMAESCNASHRLETICDVQSARLAELAQCGLTVAPMASAHGWIALPWVQGRRLCPSDADAGCIDRVGAYIKRAARPPLGSVERERAFERLRQVLICNTRGTLGEPAAQRAERASDRLASEIVRLELPSYGDGRLAPHEWLRSSAGVLKLDAAGHHQDHTAIGPQSIWWDIAGAAVEWNLDEAALDRLAHASGLRTCIHAAYFRAAYAAFKAGAAHLGADIHPCERHDFDQVARCYSRHLDRALSRLEA